MLLSVQCWVDITTIIANVVTILGIPTVIFALVMFFRNKLSEKSFQVKVTPQNSHSDTTKHIFHIDLINFTDKEFSIYEINFIIGENTFPFEKSTYQEKFEISEAAKNIVMSAHESITVKGYIIVPRTIKLPQSYMLQVKTTQKTLCYNLPISTFTYSKK